MKINRTKNATRNIIFGLLLKVYQIVVPFFMRTAMVYYMGVQYLGLNSLFTSILHVLNLAELGVGNALIYSMYESLANNDDEKTCALMQLYKIYYRIIGLVILGLGMCLLPFVPNLIKGTVPADINIYVLYLLNLLATVVSYWLFAYKCCVIWAHQRNDVYSKVGFFTDTVKYVVQLLSLIVFKNYYFYVMIFLFSQMLANVLNAIMADRMYPQFKAKGKLAKEEVQKINQRIRDLFTAKIGTVVLNPADTIVISAFLGLEILAIYQNYFYILTSVIAFIRIIFNSCTAGIGNSLIVETKEKNIKDFKMFTFLIAWIAVFCSSCFLCLYQPFMKLWMGEDLMVEFAIVICLCVYFFVFLFNLLFETYKDASGIWREDRFRPLVTAVVNLCLNIILVQFVGLYGVVLSTVLSMAFIGMPWILQNLFTTIFEKQYLKEQVKNLGSYVVVTIVGCGVTYFICTFVPFTDYIELVTKAIVCCIVPNIIFLLCFYKREEFKWSMNLVNRMVGGRLSFLKRFM